MDTQADMTENIAHLHTHTRVAIIWRKREFEVIIVVLLIDNYNFRTVCMFGVSPYLMKMRSNLTWNEIMLFAWVGIRGTMCLVLALEVIMDSHFDTTFRLQSKV